jgi:hypothetical protein
MFPFILESKHKNKLKDMNLQRRLFGRGTGKEENETREFDGLNMIELHCICVMKMS